MSPQALLQQHQEQLQTESTSLGAIVEVGEGEEVSEEKDEREKGDSEDEDDAVFADEITVPAYEQQIGLSRKEVDLLSMFIRLALPLQCFMFYKSG